MNVTDEMTALRERKGALLARAESIQTELDLLAVQTLDVSYEQQVQLLQKHQNLVTELRMIPAQAGELERRFVLLCLQRCRSELADLDERRKAIAEELQPYSLPEQLTELKKTLSKAEYNHDRERVVKIREAIAVASRQLEGIKAGPPLDFRKYNQLKQELGGLSDHEAAIVQEGKIYFQHLNLRRADSAEAKQQVISLLNHPGLFPEAAQHAGERVKAQAIEKAHF